METVKQHWLKSIYEAVCQYGEQKGIERESVQSVELILQNPPKPDMGDFAVPMFPLAKVLRTAPAVIADETVSIVKQMPETPEGSLQAEGPYINITADLSVPAAEVWKQISESGNAYGESQILQGQKIMIEFSCPNTNKPLHLGHLRNDAIGESMAAILLANGADVRRVNLINDRGVHICKSMLAYILFGNGETPESSGMKSDHFVGTYYVKFNEWKQDHPEAEEQAQMLLVKWEEGDEETLRLWKMMNTWAIDGVFETYRKTGIKFDEVYYESKTYMLGRDFVMKGLEEGVFYKDADGTVWVDLDEIGLDRKVLLRRDGTSLYLTQDLGTAAARHDDWPFDQLIYVVGSEQQYHFKVLFHVLKKLGMPWAAALHHLSYGMVNLPEGKMKSREGKVVDADDLIDDLTRLSRQEIIDKERANEVDSVEETALSVAIGALHYYLLQVNPAKDMIFNPAESIAFNGNTGPYLQYVGARISSMLRKYRQKDETNSTVDYINKEFIPRLLTLTEEHALLKMVLEYPDFVQQAGQEMNPGILASFLYEICRIYSRYYHDHSVLKAGTDSLVFARIVLSEMVLAVLKNGFRLLNIPFLEKM